MTRRKDRSLVLSVVAWMIVGLSLSMAGKAYAGSSTGTQAAARTADGAAIAATLDASPSDVQLVAATDDTLIDLSIRCVGISGQTYCLHEGWVTGSPDDAVETVRAQAKAQAAAIANSGEARSNASGDTPLIADLRSWAAQTRSSRLAAETAELSEARSAVGKVIMFAALLAGTPLPADFDTQYPEWAAIADRLVGEPAAGRGFALSGGPTPSVATICDNGTNVGCGYAPMYTSQLAKQTQTYNCGAASMQGIAWNNPTGAVYKSQAAWETILGTTRDGGTSIYNIKNAINSYTDWDSAAYAGTYYVVSISNWSESNYRTMFANHLRDLHAPVQLHPVLNSYTSTYYPGSTSGHFNVLMGYDYSVGDWNYLYEPAGGPPQGNIYPSKTAWEDTIHIRRAQLANSNKNISY